MVQDVCSLFQFSSSPDLSKQRRSPEHPTSISYAYSVSGHIIDAMETGAQPTFPEKKGADEVNALLFSSRFCEDGD